MEGKGLVKEYFFNNKLKFEEYYLEGEKQNVKGYDQYGNIIYKLENGNGTIREYNLKERLIFDGIYLNVKRSGRGKEFDFDKLIFEGE